MINITTSDIKRSLQVTQGWYLVRVDNHSTEAAATDGSRRDIFNLVIVSPGEFDEVPLTFSISEKAPGFAIPFLKACGAPIGVAGGPLEKGGSVDPKKCVGVTIECYVKNELYQGRMLNKPADFAKVGTNLAA